jgi:hypothetical protein
LVELDSHRHGDLTIAEVAERLRVSVRTLEGWLSADLARGPDDRRFQFHVRRGRKRLWSAKATEALAAAIERESEPGGVLAVSKSKTVAATGTSPALFAPAAVQSACAEVLAFRLRPPRGTMPGQKLGSSKATSQLKRAAKRREATRLP